MLEEIEAESQRLKLFLSNLEVTLRTHSERKMKRMCFSDQARSMQGISVTSGASATASRVVQTNITNEQHTAEVTNLLLRSASAERIKRVHELQVSIVLPIVVEV
jgi:hypothetical protein